ncbi:response regulator [Emcibacter sp. SYSU 3D8]|uniref:response regulator n=1 Tax=Emcibacter sp. SYSU 3D8 TaxID=3133969 RepID=UPI0031FF064F
MTTILVVDDKEDNLYYLKALLEGVGYDVVAARHGAEALVLARQSLPDIVVSDLLMPVMDGYTLLRHWKADPRLSAVPFIVYTATYTEADDETLAMDLGADAFIMKPAEPEDFIATLRQVESGPARSGTPRPKEPKADEDSILKLYSKTLIRKLEEKSLQLEQTNRTLETDIAERKAVEASLRESEQRFRLVAETIDEVFWITDPPKSRMIYVSPAFERIWGRPCEDLYQSPALWLDAVHEDDRERVDAAAAEQHSGATYDETYRIRRPDGTQRWIHDRAFPVRTSSGEIIQMVGMAEDITERRQLEEEFRQAQKMEAIGRLAGGVAHDFNNILAAIMMQAEMACMAEELPAEASGYLDDIRGAAERAANLTRQLLAFSRRQVLQSRSLDINRAVTSLGRMLNRLLGDDVRLHLKLHDAPLAVRADAGMLDQVLLNLVVNARDAMPSGGRITVATRISDVTAEDAAGIEGAVAGRHVRLSVADTGIGIAPDNLTRIFDPFFTTKEAGKGTGLGLATVFGIVRQHGGWVTVESQVGKGTTFHVYLPFAASDTVPGESAAPAPAPTAAGTENILLVEDEISVRVITRALLERQGYAVHEAASGVEALEVWERRERPFSLLFTDLVMPEGINGRELASRLQSRDPRLKVIYTSGYSGDVAGRELSLREGWNFLQKPYTRQRLLEAVRRALDGAD